ncbi:unnamed protein product [Neospora caninum Liverpool]|uniref:AP2 domain transcription factor AP2III-2 n=1 Tax=Neospora caninum (strain Liverpool) TaxID=572307 RepID=F0V982_NEOCL|nr:uncharacterized protein NCLIV_007810 [Neospora caninum Liverpool]CBZ50307.1 unnamed protein product [Neospora caninum Liverpool]CEL64913.1 TPA: AP2 domain transcription factor AP2III-2 [Neospora caninum Liverpool]|eukprot:XP_003880341.1 uncharacterized protein NCLIV_007810 [Neospora caninum Liverpool]
MINLHQLFRVFSRVSSSPSDPSAPNASLASVPAVQTLSSFPTIQQDLLASLASASLPGPDSATMSSSPTSLLNSPFCGLQPASRKPSSLAFPSAQPKTPPHLPAAFPASALSTPPPSLQELLLSSPDLAAVALASLQKQQLRLALGTDKSGSCEEGRLEMHSLLPRKAMGEDAMWPWPADREGDGEPGATPGAELPLSLSSFLNASMAPQTSVARSAHLPSSDFSLPDETLRVANALSPALAENSDRSPSCGAAAAQAPRAFCSLHRPSACVPQDEGSRTLDGNPDAFPRRLTAALPSHPCRATVPGADAPEEVPASGVLTLVAPETPDATAKVESRCLSSKDGLRRSSADHGDAHLLSPPTGLTASAGGRLLTGPCTEATRTTTTSGSAAPDSSLPFSLFRVGDCEGAERALAILEAAPLNGFSFPAGTQSGLGCFAEGPDGTEKEGGALQGRAREVSLETGIAVESCAAEAGRRGHGDRDGEAEASLLVSASRNGTSKDVAGDGGELECGRDDRIEVAEAVAPHVAEMDALAEVGNDSNSLECSAAIEGSEGPFQRTAPPYVAPVAPAVCPSAASAIQSSVDLWREGTSVGKLETEAAGRPLDAGTASLKAALWDATRLAAPAAVPSASTSEAPAESHPARQELVLQDERDSAHPLFASFSSRSSSAAAVPAGAAAGIASPFPSSKTPKAGASEPGLLPEHGELANGSRAGRSSLCLPAASPSSLSLQDGFSEGVPSLARAEAPEAVADDVGRDGGSDTVGERGAAAPGSPSRHPSSSPSSLLPGSPGSLLLLLRNGHSGAAALVAAMQQRQAATDEGLPEETGAAVLAGAGESPTGAMRRPSRGEGAPVADGDRGSENAQIAAKSNGNSSDACATAREGGAASLSTSGASTNNPASSSTSIPSRYSSSPASSGVSITSSSTPPGLPTPRPGGGMSLAPSAASASPAAVDASNLQSLFLWGPQASPLQPGLPAEAPAASSCRSMGASGGLGTTGAPAAVAGLLQEAWGSGPFGEGGSADQLAAPAGPFGAATPASAAFHQQLLLLSAAFDQIGSSAFPGVGGDAFLGYGAPGAARPDALGISAAAAGGTPASLPVLLAAANAGVRAGGADQPDFLALLGGSSSHHVPGEPAGGVAPSTASAGHTRGLKRQYGQQTRGAPASQSANPISPNRPGEGAAQGPGGTAVAPGRATKKQRRGPAHSAAAVSAGASPGLLSVGGCPSAQGDAKGPSTEDFFLQQLQQSRNLVHGADSAAAVPGSAMTAPGSCGMTAPTSWPSMFSDCHTLSVNTGSPSPSLCNISHAGVIGGASASNPLGSFPSPACLPQLPETSSTSAGGLCEAQQTSAGGVAEATALGGGVSAISGHPNSRFPGSAGGGVGPGILNLSAVSQAANQTPCCPNSGTGALLSGSAAGTGLFFGGTPSSLQKASVYAGGDGNVSSSSGDAIAAAAILHLRTLQQLQELQRQFQQRPAGVLAPPVTPAAFLPAVAVRPSAGVGTAAPGTHSNLVCSSASPMPGAARSTGGPEGRGSGGDSGPSKRGNGGVSSGAQQFLLLQLKQTGSHSNAHSLGAQGNAATSSAGNCAPGGPGTQPHHPGVCYSPPKDVWRARITVDGRQHEQQFSVKRHGFEEARLLAVQWRAHMESLRLGGAAKNKGNAGASSASATTTSQASSHSPHQPQLKGGGAVVSGDPGVCDPTTGAGAVPTRGL